MPCGRWKIASVKRRRKRDSRRENGDRRIEAENSGSRGCCRRSMAATGFLFILRGRLGESVLGPCRYFTTDVSGGALGGAACVKRRVFPAMRKSGKLGAPACGEKPTHTGICGSKGTYSYPGITLCPAFRAKSISSVTMARRRHLWRSERAPSGKTCRRCRNLVLPGKNNTWWFARRSDFWRNGTSASVPAGSM